MRKGWATSGIAKQDGVNHILANENIPYPTIGFLRDKGINVLAIADDHRGIDDKQVMQLAINEGRTIITHDSDYGELIFKYGLKPAAGVIFSF